MTNLSLDDLLEGRDKLLTSGEVAEILNVNVNTLYLWRTSPEVVLPFQRFVSPGQVRGMIRYRYSDVTAFIESAMARGAQDVEAPKMSDEDARLLLQAGERIVKAKKKKKKGKAKVKALGSSSLEGAWKVSGTFGKPVVNEVDANVRKAADEALEKIMSKFNEVG